MVDFRDMMVDFRTMMDLIEISIGKKSCTDYITYNNNNEVPFIIINRSYGFFFINRTYSFVLNKKLLKETDIILYIRKNKYNKERELIFLCNGKIQTFNFDTNQLYKKLFRKLKRYSKSYKILKINKPYLF